ncbi:MAG TPA: tRNA (adenosine(37)-N6)-threonylcarbamoyltransferase complex ATPase subunit type 1 TsaE [Coleofasciculaceae cyanobacterium]|jgi:tRNA threonylcarbamoyladenosine biosynthesis protein TsaE
MSSLPYQSKHHVDSLQSLARFAEKLAMALKAGDVVTLDGPLGAGKTTLTRLLGDALGLKEPVTSPTFVLMHEYLSGPLPVVHVDLYRLGEQNAGTLADELFAIIDEGRSLMLVEWACYGPFLDDYATIAIRIAPDADNPEAREIAVSSNRPLSLEGAEA